jgi:hypothetical protein
MIQSRAVVTSTLTTFSPKGFSSPGVTYFTTLKLTAKIMFAARTAICAFTREFNSKEEGYGKDCNNRFKTGRYCSKSNSGIL